MCQNTSAWDCKKLGEKLGTLGQNITRIKVQREVETTSGTLETNSLKLLGQMGKRIRRY